MVANTTGTAPWKCYFAAHPAGYLSLVDFNIRLDSITPVRRYSSGGAASSTALSGPSTPPSAIYQNSLARIKTHPRMQTGGNRKEGKRRSETIGRSTTTKYRVFILPRCCDTKANCVNYTIQYNIEHLYSWKVNSNLHGVYQVCWQQWEREYVWDLPGIWGCSSARACAPSQL